MVLVCCHNDKTQNCNKTWAINPTWPKSHGSLWQYRCRRLAGPCCSGRQWGRWSPTSGLTSVSPGDILRSDFKTLFGTNVYRARPRTTKALVLELFRYLKSHKLLPTIWRKRVWVPTNAALMNWLLRGALVTRKSIVMKTIFRVPFFKRLKEGMLKIYRKRKPKKNLMRPVCPLSGKMVRHHDPNDQDDWCRDDDSHKARPEQPHFLNDEKRIIMFVKIMLAFTTANNICIHQWNTHISERQITFASSVEIFNQSCVPEQG